MAERRFPPPWSVEELVRQAVASSVWLRSGDWYCRLSRCRVGRGALDLRGVGVPIRIYRAISAAGNDGGLALVHAVIVTMPSGGRAPVRHMAPLGVPLLVSLTRWHVHA
jgi:hypothetical protein